jgi:hypothetical protein
MAVCCGLPANVDDCPPNLDAGAASNINIAKIRSTRPANRAFSAACAQLMPSNGGERFGVAFFMGC